MHFEGSRQNEWAKKSVGKGNSETDSVNQNWPPRFDRKGNGHIILWLEMCLVTETASGGYTDALFTSLIWTRSMMVWIFLKNR